MMASKGEVAIHRILSEHGARFAEEVEFPDLVTTNGRHLRFDFAVYRADNTLDYLLEFQGQQHYRASSLYGGERGLRRQRYNDTLKQKWCLKHGVPLVCIPYWDEGDLSYDYIMRALGR